MSKRAINRHALKDFREGAGMRPIDLARAANVSAPYLCEIEAGKRNPSEAVVAKLASALNVDVRSLFCPIEQLTATGGQHAV